MLSLVHQIDVVLVAHDAVGALAHRARCAHVARACGLERWARAVSRCSSRQQHHTASLPLALPSPSRALVQPVFARLAPPLQSHACSYRCPSNSRQGGVTQQAPSARSTLWHPPRVLVSYDCSPRPSSSVSASSLTASTNPKKRCRGSRGGGGGGRPRQGHACGAAGACQRERATHVTLRHIPAAPVPSPPAAAPKATSSCPPRTGGPWRRGAAGRRHGQREGWAEGRRELCSSQPPASAACPCPRGTASATTPPCFPLQIAQLDPAHPPLAQPTSGRSSMKNRCTSPSPPTSCFSTLGLRTRVQRAGQQGEHARCSQRIAAVRGRQRVRV